MASFDAFFLLILKKVNNCSIFLTKTLDFYFFSCIIKAEIRTDVLKNETDTPLYDPRKDA